MNEVLSYYLARFFTFLPSHSVIDILGEPICYKRYSGQNNSEDFAIVFTQKKNISAQIMHEPLRKIFSAKK